MKTRCGRMRRMRAGVIGLMCAISCAAWAMEPIQVSMTKKTDTRSQVKARPAPRGKAWSQSSRQLYRIELRRVMPSAPEDAVVQWLLVKEMPNGRLIPAVHGRTNMTLDLGKPAVFETDAVDCGTVDIIRPLGKGAPVHKEERLHGCIVRIYDTAGELVTEKYMPTSLAKEADVLLKRAGVRPPQ